MQFTINSKSFLAVLSAVGRVVPAKAVLQILSNYLVEIKDGEIAVTAADIDNHATMTVDAATDGAGAFCIDAKFLSNVVRSLPDCPVTVQVNDNYDVLISTDKNSFNAVAIGAQEYPQPTAAGDAVAEFQLSTETLLTGLGETSFAVGTDDYHPQMMGVCVDAKPDGVTFVATDTRMLMRSVHTVEIGSTARCIVPQAAINAVSALAAKSPNTTVTITPTAIKFRGDGFSLQSQLIKGNYPDYNRVIPQNNPHTVSFNRAELLGAVRRVAACADSQYGVLRFKFDDDNVVVSSSDLAFSRSAKETIACDSNSTDVLIGLSAELLSKLLSALVAETVSFHIADSSRAVVITCAGDDHLTALIMPMVVNQ